MTTQTRIAVIGAGIVGCSCALWLQKKGFEVILIDPEDPGSGTSSGNAGTIAEYGCVPVNSPDLFWRLPALLFSRDSPLNLNLAYALSHPAWMIEFLVNCRKHKVDRAIRLLGGLLAKVYDGLDPLLDMADARDLLTQQGFMHVYLNQQEFDAAFPYQETPDQLGALAVIKQDMQDPKPMDRLLCGDVGFGKTELAVRSAFKAIDAGYQVAVLVPTTVLAEQHKRTFSQRMAEFPFEIAALSRFCTAK